MNTPQPRTIALMTADFRAFLDLAAHFRAHGVPFQALALGDEIPAQVGVVVTTEAEAGRIDFPTVVIANSPEGTLEQARRALHGLAELRTLIIGVDPGERPGFAVVGDGRVLGSRQLPGPDDVTAAADAARRHHPAARVIVRVGHGAATVRDRIINALLAAGHFVEEVDETATSPHRARGRAERDAAAARAIALSPGHRVTRRRPVTVPEGELRDLQRRSREASGGDLTIPRALAVEVATGRLTLEQAIAEAKKRRGTQNGRASG